MTDHLTKAVQMLNRPGCPDCEGRGFKMVRGSGMNLAQPEKCQTCNGSGLPRLLRQSVTLRHSPEVQP